MKIKPVKFPLTVRFGSCQASVYKSINKGYPSFTVSYQDANNIRQRVTFSTFETAKEEAERLMRGIAQGDSGAGILRDADRFAYTRALEILRPTGLALDLAVHQVAEAHKLLKGASVLDAVRYFALHNCQDRPVRTVAEVADELRANRQKGGASELYIRDLRIRLGRLATAFQCPIASLTRPDIEAHLNSLNGTPRTLHNHRTTIGTMLNFAVDQGYLPAGHPILGRATRCFKGQTKPEVFTPAEMEKLLKTAKPELVPALAIAGFAGVRAAEISSGIDVALSPPRRLTQLFPGVRFGVVDSAAGSLPVRLGGTRLVTFSPLGTSTSGSLYLAGRDGSQYVLRIAGAAARVRILRLNRATGTWGEL